MRYKFYKGESLSLLFKTRVPQEVEGQETPERKTISEYEAAVTAHGYTAEIQPIDQFSFRAVFLAIQTSKFEEGPVDVLLALTQNKCRVIGKSASLECVEPAVGETLPPRNDIIFEEISMSELAFEMDLNTNNLFTEEDRSAILLTMTTAVEQANEARDLANEKAGLADEKAGDANTAANLANEKADLADRKAGLANSKAELADTAAGTANTKAGLANDAAALADEKAGDADRAASLANEKANLADEKAGDAASAATLANQKAGLANQKAELADTAAGTANTKAGLANDAAALANEVGTHPPKVVADFWHIWNTTSKAYEATLLKARGDNAYEYYYDNTDDDPKLTEAQFETVLAEMPANEAERESNEDGRKSNFNKLEEAEETVAAALVTLKKQVDALEALLRAALISAAEIKTLSVTGDLNVVGKTNMVIEGTATPATPPDRVGQLFINKTNGNCFVSKGDGSVADWKQINNS